MLLSCWVAGLHPLLLLRLLDLNALQLVCTPCPHTSLLAFRLLMKLFCKCTLISVLVVGCIHAGFCRLSMHIS